MRGEGPGVRRAARPDERAVACFIRPAESRKKVAERPRALEDGGEVCVADRALQLLELCVELDDVRGVQGVQDAIPDQVKRKEIAVYRRRVARIGIDQELHGPKVEAGEVDLGRRPITQLQVEAPLGDVDRSLA